MKPIANVPCSESVQAVFLDLAAELRMRSVARSSGAVVVATFWAWWEGHTFATKAVF
jgi:hypothetical protein